MAWNRNVPEFSYRDFQELHTLLATSYETSPPPLMITNQSNVSLALLPTPSARLGQFNSGYETLPPRPLSLMSYTTASIADWYRANLVLFPRNIKKKRDNKVEKAKTKNTNKAKHQNFPYLICAFVSWLFVYFQTSLVKSTCAGPVQEQTGIDQCTCCDNRSKTVINTSVQWW